MKNTVKSLIYLAMSGLLFWFYFNSYPSLTIDSPRQTIAIAVVNLIAAMVFGAWGFYKLFNPWLAPLQERARARQQR